MKTATLALALAFGATAAQAVPIYKCTDAHGRPVYADRHIGSACRSVRIEPYPVDGKPETYDGRVVIGEPEPMQPPSAVRATVNPPLPGELR